MGAEDSPGASDEQVLQRAAGESRTLLTLDKDFGELVFRQGQPAAPGVVLVRIEAESPEEIASIVSAALKTAGGFRGHFAVVTRNRIRMTPLPRRG